MVCSFIDHWRRISWLCGRTSTSTCTLVIVKSMEYRFDIYLEFYPNMKSFESGKKWSKLGPNGIYWIKWIDPFHWYYLIFSSSYIIINQRNISVQFWAAICFYSFLYGLSSRDSQIVVIWKRTKDTPTQSCFSVYRFLNTSTEDVPKISLTFIIFCWDLVKK